MQPAAFVKLDGSETQTPKPPRTGMLAFCVCGPNRSLVLDLVCEAPINLEKFGTDNLSF